MIPDHQLTPYLKQLRLSGILATLEVRTEQAIREQWSFVEFVTRLLQDEAERRNQKQLDQRLRRGKVQAAKTLESFDFSFNPSINRQQLLDLAACSFVRKRRNVLICGQTGVGKSHLAQALANEAARQGFDVVCTDAHALLLHLYAGRADGSVERRLQIYTKPALLVIDDFGLKPLPPSGPADLYDIINARYEHGSIILTSNRAVDEWPELWGDPLLASAGLDRLAHGATVVTIT
ncbi:MAG: ATP-binding protein, partial [Chloroflexi bacterium]|nr:ATP-binding protein [Chloroflexota bacterium]